MKTNADFQALTPAEKAALTEEQCREFVVFDATEAEQAGQMSEARWRAILRGSDSPAAALDWYFTKGPGA